jgi:hypothetical protein
MRGSTLNWNSGGTVSYTPWSANELVSRTQDFIQEITSSFTDSDHKLTIAIDEIDRIGSLDDVKKFFYEIKPLSDISKCFFLAAATENISSIFTQHPAIRQSNSADDFRTVDVAPLNFTETRDLLLKRVPGFTDPYVYLVLALSGGLPRELIRVTYRLVDVKQELRNIDNGRYPRLAELALTLAKDEVCDRIEATRARLLDLHLHDGWQTFIQHIHSTLGHLQSLLPPARTAYTWEAYHLIEELSKLPVPEYPENAGARPTPVPEAEDNARELAKRLTTFAYLGITVIDAFSNESFDLERIQQAAAAGSEDSYQRLAAACAELSISPDMSRTTLRSFRGSLPRPDP